MPSDLPGKRQAAGTQDANRPAQPSRDSGVSVGTIDPARFQQPATVIPSHYTPLVVPVDWRQPRPDFGAGQAQAAAEAAPAKSNTLAWVLAALGVAGAGVWYVTRKPAKNPTRRSLDELQNKALDLQAMVPTDSEAWMHLECAASCETLADCETNLRLAAACSKKVRRALAEQ